MATDLSADSLAANLEAQAEEIEALISIYGDAEDTEGVSRATESASASASGSGEAAFDAHAEPVVSVAVVRPVSGIDSSGAAATAPALLSQLASGKLSSARVDVRVAVPVERLGHALQATLEVHLPHGYPRSSAPTHVLHCHWMDADATGALTTSLQELYDESGGDAVLFAWTERLKEACVEAAGSDPSDHSPASGASASASASAGPAPAALARHGASTDTATAAAIVAASTSQTDGDAALAAALAAADEADAIDGEAAPGPERPRFVESECPPISSGPPFTDRKSVFQAHAAAVKSVEEVRAVMASLLSDRKIARATHNIMAYRIQDTSSSAGDATRFISDNDDDGETAAGSRVAHLLEMMKVTGAIVVVTRWYGGIQLGPDRFKHINNCARSILEETGLGGHDRSKDGTGSGAGSGKGKSKGGGGKGKVQGKGGKGGKRR